MPNGILDRALPLPARIFLVLACAFLPTFYIASSYAKRSDLTQVLSFGEGFRARELPEVRRLHPAVEPGLGFDGQFYAQIALDPTCRRPDLPGALDDPGLRMQRILLPALAHALGAGQPASILFSYALLNLFFWYALLALLVWKIPARNLRGFLALFAVMLSTGTLISVQSALTDLPAVTLGMMSLFAGEMPASLLIALALLTKPTSGLFLLRYAVPFPCDGATWARRAALIFLALAPAFLWQLYLWNLLRSPMVDASQFGPPWEGWWHRLVSSWQMLEKYPWPLSGEVTTWEWNVFEFLALISTTIQAVFLLARPQLTRPLWLVGAAFAILLLCFSDKNYAAEVGYTRTVLPMTIAFNILLLEVRSAPRYLVLFLAGNVGLLEGAGDMLRLSFLNLG